MLFQIYGDTALWQLLGWALVFTGLVLANEIARRSKAGGIFFFLVLPAALSVYFIVINVAAAKGVDWAVNNDTVVHTNSWFHYAKLYAATAGCIGFMMLKYKWSIGKTQWFKVFPFVIVAINILIAVASDCESARKGWWGIYSSKNHQDMLWPDMTWCYILAYDIWNFEYTYNNLPTHSWYCGLALLLAPTFANALWNKGGWIQNRAYTLAIWCMFAQVFPLFQDQGKFAVITSVYADGFMNPAVHPTAANPTAQGVISVLALAVNVVVFGFIMKKAKETKTNPYRHEIFTHQKDFQLAMSRAESK